MERVEHTQFRVRTRDGDVVDVYGSTQIAVTHGDKPPLQTARCTDLRLDDGTTVLPRNDGWTEFQWNDPRAPAKKVHAHRVDD